MVTLSLPFPEKGCPQGSLCAHWACFLTVPLLHPPLNTWYPPVNCSSSSTALCPRDYSLVPPPHCSPPCFPPACLILSVYTQVRAFDHPFLTLLSLSSSLSIISCFLHHQASFTLGTTPSYCLPTQCNPHPMWLHPPVLKYSAFGLCVLNIPQLSLTPCPSALLYQHLLISEHSNMHQVAWWLDILLLGVIQDFGPYPDCLCSSSFARLASRSTYDARLGGIKCGSLPSAACLHTSQGPGARGLESVHPLVFPKSQNNPMWTSRQI